jgi:hypothetical protein
MVEQNEMQVTVKKLLEKQVLAIGLIHALLFCMGRKCMERFNEGQFYLSIHFTF